MRRSFAGGNAGEGNGSAKINRAGFWESGAVIKGSGPSRRTDAGFSAKKLSALLLDAGESLARIDAIFLTHEHNDHAAGIDGLKKHPHIQVFANPATSRAVQSKLDAAHRPAWQLFETGSRFRYRDLEVTTFAVPHDAQEPVGFRFTTRQVAQEYEVAGYVQNLADGRVRLEAEGAESEVYAFIGAIEERMHGHIRKVERASERRVIRLGGAHVRHPEAVS